MNTKFFGKPVLNVFYEVQNDCTLLVYMQYIPKLHISQSLRGYYYRRVTHRHRRRINTEEKAKVVAAVCGTEFIKFLAALAILH